MSQNPRQSKSIRAQLLTAMQVGEYAHCDRLPRESVLSEMLGISRTQLRDILASLDREGFITRRHGVGTIINRHVLGAPARMDIEVEFLDMIRQSGHTPGVAFVRAADDKADSKVAAQLGSRARDLYTVAREPMPLVGAAEYTRRHDPKWLVQAWFNLMGRSTRKKKPTQEKFEPLVTAPFVSVASRVSHMLRGLLKGSLQKMGQLFSHEESRSTNVATFLALLELIRAGRVKVDDSGTLQLDRTHRRRKDKTP